MGQIHSNIECNQKIETDFLRSKGIEPNRMEKWTEQQKFQLIRIINGDIHNHMISFDEEFNKFCEIIPEWKEDNVILFWKFYPTLRTIKVLRRQLSGLCYMHAPVVLQHYMSTILHGDNNFKMIDVARFISEHWSAKEIVDYIERDLGGKSIMFLEQITEHLEYESISIPSKSRKILYDETCEELLRQLEKKPALVSGFDVDENFQKEGLAFKGIKNKTHVGFHAMLLIGGRKGVDINGEIEYYFLLQNWWLNRFFIEVTGEYMNSCKAQLYFVTNNTIKTPEKITFIYSPYAETTVDVSEKLNEM
jgi:hypothetical protein